MPYNYDPNLDPERQRQLQTPQLAGALQTMGGASQTAPTGTPVTAAEKGPSSSGSFTSLNKYLDANSGSGFGNQFAGRINEDVNAANSAQERSAQSFKQASDAGLSARMDFNANGQPLVDPVKTALENPTDEKNQSEFSRYLGASYDGPQQYQDHASSYQQAFGATKKAGDVANAGRTEAGRFSLLDDYFGNSGYNQGQKSLDNLLSQGDSQFQEGLNQARANAGAARNNFAAQSGQLANYAAANAGAAEKTKAYAKDQGTKALTGERQSQATALANAEAARQKIINDKALAASANNSLAGGYGAASYFADPTVDNYGRAAQGQDSGFWGLDLGDYLNPTASPATASSVVNAEQARKLNALEKLMGESETKFNDSELGKFNAGGLDKAAYDAAVRAQQNKYRSEVGNKWDWGFLEPGQMPIGGWTPGSDPSNGYLAPSAASGYSLASLNAIRAKYGLAPLTTAQASAGVVSR